MFYYLVLIKHMKHEHLLNTLGVRRAELKIVIHNIDDDKVWFELNKENFINFIYHILIYN